MSISVNKTEYDRGFDDGYVEGYACKLVDVTESFTPSGSVAEIEIGASWLLKHYGTCFSRSEAIGAVRAIFACCRDGRAVSLE